MIFVFDENYPIEFVHGLATLERANKRSKIKAEIFYSPEADGCGYNASDEDIIEAFAHREAVIVTHDLDFKKAKHYKPLLRDYEVGYVIFRVPKGGYYYWDIVKAFINKWEELKEKISQSEHPFAWEVNKHGHLTQLRF